MFVNIRSILIEMQHFSMFVNSILIDISFWRSCLLEVRNNDWKLTLVLNELGVKFFDSYLHGVETAQGHMFFCFHFPFQLLSSLAFYSVDDPYTFWGH